MAILLFLKGVTRLCLNIAFPVPWATPLDGCQQLKLLAGESGAI